MNTSLHTLFLQNRPLQYVLVGHFGGGQEDSASNDAVPVSASEGLYGTVDGFSLYERIGIGKHTDLDIGIRFNKTKRSRRCPTFRESSGITGQTSSEAVRSRRVVMPCSAVLFKSLKDHASSFLLSCMMFFRYRKTPPFGRVFCRILGLTAPPPEHGADKRGHYKPRHRLG